MRIKEIIMSTITIKYNVTEAVRRSELGAGRDASREHEIDVDPTPALASIANLTGGDGCVNLQGLDEADHVLTNETAEAWALATHARDVEARAARAAESEAKEAQRSKRLREEKEEREKTEDERLENPDLDWASLVSRDGHPEWAWANTLQRHPEALVRARAFRAARDAAEAEQIEHSKIAAKDYVLSHVPDYVRAAVEGCDVRHRATDHVLSLLADLGGFETFSDTPHTCPSATAYAKLDEVRGRLASLDVLCDARLAITRADVSPTTDKRIRTCVRITHTMPWGVEIDRSVLAEPEPDDDASDD